MKRTLTILFAAMLLGIACKKNTETKQDAVETALKPATALAVTGDCTPENPANIMDKAGATHNDVMDYLAASGHRTHPIYISDLLAAANKYSLQHSNTPLAPVTPADIKRYYDDIPHDFVNIIQAMPYSDAAKQYAMQLQQLIFGLYRPGQDTVSYCFVKSRIMDFEAVVMADKQLNDKERKMILGGASVARYSAYRIFSDLPVALPNARWGIVLTRGLVTAIAADAEVYNDTCDENQAGVVSYIVLAQFRGHDTLIFL